MMNDLFDEIGDLLGPNLIPFVAYHRLITPSKPQNVYSEHTAVLLEFRDEVSPVIRAGAKAVDQEDNGSRSTGGDVIDVVGATPFPSAPPILLEFESCDAVGVDFGGG